MAEEKDDWLDDLDTPEEKESELGQSDIDALLSGSGEVNPPPRGVDELGQSDIDALLSTPDAPAQEQALPDPEQDEIDKLFTDLDDTGDAAESQPFPAEDIDFGDAFGAVDEASPPAQSSMPDLDAQEFKLESDFDIPDIPDPAVGMDAVQSDEDEPTVPLATEAVSTVKTVPPSVGEAAGPVLQPGGKFVPNRKVLFAIGGGVAAVIILAATLFLFKGGDKTSEETAKEAAIAKLQESAAEPEVVHQEAPQPPTEAHPEPSTEERKGSETPAVATGAPTLSDLSVVLPEGGSELAISLDGKDPDNDPLEYEFQSMPEHGQIAGHPPHLVYIPRADFADRDSFTIRVTDGKHISPTATVTISRSIAPKVIEETPAPIVPVIPEPPVETAQQLTPSAAEEKAPAPPPVATPATEVAPASMPAAPPAAETIAARNVSYTISHSLVIPWGKIWGKGNEQPYSPEVRVEILQQPRHGRLQTSKGSPSVYKPDPDFSGKDVIRYRFTRGGLNSEPKTVTIAVKRKHKTPELHIEPYSAVYNAGDTVFLNASRTQEQARGRVRFRWEQIAGVPVVIKPLNSEESQIAFVAPSTFNTVSNPGVVIRVTATDEKGWSVARELFIKTQSRRSSALWR